MSLSFSASVECNCDGCGLRATHGFFLSSSDEDTDSEIFLCTGCAQRDVPLHTLEDAIEDHRQVCFDRVDAAQAEVERCDEAIEEWLCYVGDQSIAC
jgi:hypothetical protein